MVKSLADIREEFLGFFGKNGHEVVRSAPLIPENDPTLMFVNAGMVPFKNYFTGMDKPKFKSVTSAQKCVRAGGKHNDLENVGYTARHHTFFEMLGNFSFGEYFKEKAIRLAWEFLTVNLGLPKEKLLVTIYHDDDEAFDIWKKIAGLPSDKIIRINSSDNFWSMGETGPCGPCSEIFYDHGDHLPGNPPGSGDEGDRFIEIWNLVFMQYNQISKDKREKLLVPAIDTGMGLERVAAILQGKCNNFDIDLFEVLIKESEKISGNKKELSSHRVIVDHLRSAAFLIADGVLPLNEGRGYVLRRIMRRAMRHVHHLGYKGKLLSELFPTLLKLMGSHYVELEDAKDLILATITQEEEQFGKTLSKGMKILEEELVNIKGKKLSGEEVFKLYDTYGFPVDLTADILRTHGLEIDEEGFQKLMAEQKQRGKDNWSGSGAASVSDVWFSLSIKESKFSGYESDDGQGEILAILDKDLKEVKETTEGSDFYIIADVTPFYAESGGQVGDLGIIADGFEVLDTQKYAGKFIGHFGKQNSGKLQVGDKTSLKVDAKRRKNIRRNHSATHLLHKVLQEILGAHVSQRGSLVNDKVLRFDFTHSQGLSVTEIVKVENRVNEIILNGGNVLTEIMALSEAKKSGAAALFGEKYSEKVRVLSMGGDENRIFSKELCGGTHVGNVSEIGLFKIVSESSVASGVRRIEAVTGARFLNYSQENKSLISGLAERLKVPVNFLDETISNLIVNRKEMQKELSLMKLQNSGVVSDDEVLVLKEKRIVVKILEGLGVKELKALGFQLRDNKVNDLYVLASSFDGKVGVVVASNDVALFKANVLIGEIVEFLGGKGGGGRDDFAQGGAPGDLKLGELKEFVESLLG